MYAMNAQLIINFTSVEDLLKVLQFLKDNDLHQLVFQANISEDTSQGDRKNWAFGIGNLGGRLDNLNVRDFAYE